MELHTDGLTRVTRDESRVIKSAASLMGDMPLFEICTHYLAVRLPMLPTQSSKRRIPRLDIWQESNELIDELKSLPVHVERAAVIAGDGLELDKSVYGLRYVYGEKLAKAAAETVRLALEGNHLSETDEVIAQTIINQQQHVS